MIDNKLKTLLAVVQYGGYSRAAAALNLTQPAVSYHIKQLEEELGITIFYGYKRAPVLTPEGEVMEERRKREMARKKIIDTGIRYQSWDEVDAALKELCVHEREAALISGALNEQIDTAKANADAQLRPIREEEARIERGIAEFATAHREDMGKLKSKQMTFGTVYFRKSTKLKLPAAAEKVREIIKRLRERGMEDCINQPEAKVNKEALSHAGMSAVSSRSRMPANSTIASMKPSPPPAPLTTASIRL